jgi:hypothetical protein
VLTAALLDLLEGWADAVDAAAAFEIDRIERHREYRDVRIGGRRSVWENVDRPLLERMRSAMLVASGVGDEVHAARRRLADAAVEPIAPPVLRARLRGDPRFRAAAAALGPLLASPSRTVRTAEYLKLTGRLYEQWVLLQILAGFRAAGLPEMTPLADREHIGLPGRTDLDRGSGFRQAGSCASATSLGSTPSTSPPRSAIRSTVKAMNTAPGAPTSSSSGFARRRAAGGPVRSRS